MNTVHTIEDDCDLFLGPDAAESGKIRLPNDAAIKARNADDDGDVEIVRVSDDNQVVVAAGGEDIVLGSAAGQKVGFFDADPVVQQAATGTATGFSAGSGTAVKDDSTFTGGSGSTAYNISDVVLALKNLGFLDA